MAYIFYLFVKKGFCALSLYFNFVNKIHQHFTVLRVTVTARRQVLKIKFNYVRRPRIPEKKSPEKWSPEKSWGERRAGWCAYVYAKLGCDQSVKTQNSTTNLKLGNKPKTRKQKIVVWASSIVASVCVECWDVVNLWKPKTRQQIFLDSLSVLQFGACRILRFTSNIFLCV